MHNCLYEGYVQHRRLNPVEHVFRYRLFMAYLDLDELPLLALGGFGLGDFPLAPARFCRGDHLGDPAAPLADAVRDLVEERTRWRPTGPIHLLTLLRNWGHYFNPLSLFYCFDSSGDKVEAVVAEVTNTPWHERHAYVLWQGNRIAELPGLRFRHPKDFHVSPFMDMDMDYTWHLRKPGPTLTVAIVNSRHEEKLFDVGLTLKRREWTRGAMLRCLVRHPWMTARVVQAIYWQAFRLWRKRCPFFQHPSRGESTQAR